MLTLFLFCQELGLEDGEGYLVQELESSPSVGQKISIGASPRWEVVKLEKFLSEKESVLVGYLNRIDLPLLPEQDWDCNRIAREYDSNNESLVIYSYPDKRLEMEFLIDGHQHYVGELLPSYERTDHPTAMRETAPYHQIDSIEVYHPEQSFYEALYVCRCKKVEAIIAA